MTTPAATKRVNLIFVGWEKEGSEISQWQEAAWVGGKKNDLVVCFGGTSLPAKWARVFGWTENESVKRNVATFLLQDPPATNLLSLVEREVSRHYRIKDWSKFDYLTVEPPPWSFAVFALVLGGTQTGLYFWFHRNTYSKPWRW